MERPNRSLLTSSEAADLLGVERRTLIRMEDNGALESIRPYPRAQRRYRRGDIEAIIAGGAA
jgi:excisionase family DNA binding protein